MTTRAQLESEREALRDLIAGEHGSSYNDALRASIKRIDALLSVDTVECMAFCARVDETVEECGDANAEQVHTLRVIADIVRRS